MFLYALRRSDLQIRYRLVSATFTYHIIISLRGIYVNKKERRVKPK